MKIVNLNENFFIKPSFIVR